MITMSIREVGKLKNKMLLISEFIMITLYITYFLRDFITIGSVLKPKDLHNLLKSMSCKL